MSTETVDERLARKAREVLEERANFERVTYRLIELWARLEGQDENAETWKYPGALDAAFVRFIGKLPAEEMMDAMRITFQNKPRGNEVKYFCAVCYRKLELMDVKIDA